MEDIYEIAFGLILHAGNSKSKSIQAVNAADKSDFEEAEKLMKEATEELKIAHEVQTKMLQEEANGEEMAMNLIMVHAQDHLAMAMTQKETALQMIRLYKRLEGEEND